MSKEDTYVTSFVARVERGYRIFIPRAVREVLEIEEGDFVEVQIKWVRKDGRKLTRSPKE
jgi:AbrB family looped-hinge helix DNA binding protein